MLGNGVGSCSEEGSDHIIYLPNIWKETVFISVYVVEEDTKFTVSKKTDARGSRSGT